MKKLVAAVLLMTMSVVALNGCGSSDTSTDESTESVEEVVEEISEEVSLDEITVGVVQYMEHAALDAACDGFVTALVEAGIPEENIEIQNAQGEQTNCATIATKFVNDQVDLILAIATPAAQAAAQATSDIPILATAVTDYESAGLTSDNISGTSDMNPVADQIALLLEIVPDAETVGVMYCSSEDNSILQAELATAELEAAGVEVLTFTAADTNEVQQVTQSTVGKVDAIYIPTDNLFAQTMATVSMVTEDAQIPVICGEGGMVEEGGLASYGLDYTKLGAQTGAQAIRILVDGEDIATMEVEYSPESDLEAFANEEMFAALGLEIPESLQ